jgi:hypothetical protein
MMKIVVYLLGTIDNNISSTAILVDENSLIYADDLRHLVFKCYK